MGIKTRSTVIIEGNTSGEILHFDAPISFWGGINVETSRVVQAGHPQIGEAIAKKILVIPNLIGSSSSSAIILELIYSGLAPKAMILGTHDAIIPIGTIAARQMGWGSIPISTLKNPDFKTGDWVTIYSNGEIQSEKV